jgi:hypothetical protein
VVDTAVAQFAAAVVVVDSVAGLVVAADAGS